VRCASPRRLNISHMWTAPASQDVGQIFDRIACDHMPGLYVRSHMTAGQDGFRDASSKQYGGLCRRPLADPDVSRLGSIDHTICSFSCKFRNQLSTVACGVLAVAG